MPAAETLPALKLEQFQLKGLATKELQPALPDVTLPEQRATPIFRNPFPLVVKGTLPPYLSNAALYRIGPGNVHVKHSNGVPYKTSHFFDMPSFLHEYRIDAARNTVTYRNGCLAESKLRAIENTPSFTFKDITFGKKDLCRSLFGKLAQLFVSSPVDPLTDKTAAPNIGVSVEQVPGKGLVALTDATDAVKIDEDKIAADHFFKFDEMIPDARGNFSCAHGHFDASTGEYINFMYKFGGARVQYHLYSIPSNGRPTVITSFEETPRYIHSFAVTDKYIIMVLWPLTLHALKIFFHQNLMAGLEYNPSEPTTYVVVSRSESKVVAKYTGESFFCFHQLNAYDVDDGLVVDISRWPNTDVLDAAAKAAMYSAFDLPGNAPARIVLSGLQDAVQSFPKPSTSVTIDVLSEKALEQPSVNPLYLRRPYRYAYGISMPSANSGKIASDKYKDSASMVVLDGKSLKEIARATLPTLMPGGFHGKVVYNG
eukprot:TRINITY_DN1847_c0_g4_i1.p1 TRINITY_DN1847_c0_g4~~TRINITY_DN1847_c0_g4_i1.p1  ORF type:complete len:484 (-),score=65.03 TRINITY_DN1847_c0_g4_i1:3542-4993(-)